MAKYLYEWCKTRLRVEATEPAAKRAIGHCPKCGCRTWGDKVEEKPVPVADAATTNGGGCI